MKVGRALMLILSLGLLTLGCGKKGDTGPMGPVGPAGPSTVIGWASIHAKGLGTSPVVYSFGGTKTTAVGVTGSAGVYTVTFTGSFAAITSLDDVTVLASISDTDTYDVASADWTQQGTFSATTLSTRVFTWSTSAGPTFVDRDFTLLLLSSK